MMRGWIAVASAEHVQHGRAEGFMQVCHGKAAPLRRIRPGEVVVYYSPTRSFGGSDRLQAFTALGIAGPGDPYAFDMGGGFRPYRRNVAWLDTQAAAIAPLLDSLHFTAGKSRWGYQFRFGLFAIEEADVQCIARAMGVQDLASFGCPVQAVPMTEVNGLLSPAPQDARAA